MYACVSNCGMLLYLWCLTFSWLWFCGISIKTAIADGPQPTGPTPTVPLFPSNLLRSRPGVDCAHPRRTSQYHAIHTGTLSTTA